MILLFWLFPDWYNVDSFPLSHFHLQLIYICLLFFTIFVLSIHTTDYFLISLSSQRIKLFCMLILLHLLFLISFFSNNVSIPFSTSFHSVFWRWYYLFLLCFRVLFILDFSNVTFAFNSVIVDQFHLFTNPFQFTCFLILLFSFLFFELWNSYFHYFWGI